MSDSLIIIPTYNEKENIDAIIRKVFSLSVPFHILVVDDNSPDGTADIVRGLKDEFKEQLHLEVRRTKSGLGTAYIHGFKWGLEHNYDLIYEMDADFSHNPDDLARLREACLTKGGDLSVGSRYTKGGKVKNWPIKRIVMSYGASLYVRMITGLRVKDPTAGFMCYSNKVLTAIDFDRIEFVGYAFQIEMKYAAAKLGFRIEEVPITFIDREKGQSKMSMKIFKEAFFGVWKLRKKYKKTKD